MNLSISNVSKTYSNGVEALKNISIEIPVGMFGLLGPNGAGKSTMMRTIATLQEPDTGSISLGDLDVIRQKEGAAFQNRHMVEQVFCRDFRIHTKYLGQGNPIFCALLEEKEELVS